MTKEQLFESFQYLDDDLITFGEERTRQSRVWKRWGCAAACLVLLAGAVMLALRSPREAKTGVPAGGKPEDTAQTQRPIQPGGVPGVPEENPPAPAGNDPAPTVLAWIDDDGAASEATDWALKQGVCMIGEKLTAEQLKACLPEIMLEWMANAEGAATYLLGDGSGGLVNVELKVTNPDWGGTTTIRIRDKDAWQVPVCGVGLNENKSTAAINGQEYSACRHYYYFGEGDPKENPPQPWVELTVRFEKENLEYTLLSNAPTAEEDNAAIDLRDLLLAYIGTHSVPDLNRYQHGEYVHRDELLSFSDARADADYGAYLPQEEPEGFDEAELRRYQLGAVGEALTDDWLLAQWYRSGEGGRGLVWRICPVTDDAKLRLASPSEREKYDFSLYPATNWYYTAAPENRLTMENPTFRASELTMELIRARTHDDYDGSALLRFSVLFDSGVLVSVDARGVSPEWVFGQLSNIADM